MKKTFLIVAAIVATISSYAQLRPGDKTGINMFETPKVETEFEKLNVKLGGSFTQGFQSLNHSNSAIKGKGTNLLDLNSGFNMASANLRINSYLSDGVVLNMELYLASRHHNEAWVKGGFIQFDKLPFLPMLNGIMKYTTIKIGQMEVNYGDAHFRRTDNGNAIYNPFIENNIMDAFATEIGGEVIVQYNNFLVVGSLTNGLLKPELAPLGIDQSTGKPGKRNPALIGKIGYDKQFTEDLRVRLTASTYITLGSGSGANTLYAGDRAGSHYFGVMQPDSVVSNGVTSATQTSSTSPFTNGRYAPGYGNKVTSFMGNLFLKYKGLEWFSTVENANGRALSQKDNRATMQFATDLLYRFGGSENFWVGGKFNMVNGEIASQTDKIKINRYAGSVGWFATKNILTKLEYVHQTYDGYAKTSILNGGKFNGIVFEAIIGF